MSELLAKFLKITARKGTTTARETGGTQKVWIATSVSLGLVGDQSNEDNGDDQLFSCACAYTTAEKAKRIIEDELEYFEDDAELDPASLWTKSGTAWSLVYNDYRAVVREIDVL